ncbi:MAG: LLM class flavin-dependent oxidoreductase [Pseudorhodoplanes sp.]
MTRQMHIGVYAMGTGNHIAGWRHPGATSSGEDIEVFKLIARACERGKLDFIFVGDAPVCMLDDHPGSLVRFEPTTLQSALEMCTTHLGLIGTSSTTYNEPYNVARQFLSLDKLSGGRAGMNIVTSSTTEVAENFNDRTLPPHQLRYEIATEFVEVVQGLWDSWEEGARVVNPQTGQFYDRSKVHALDHKGKFFSVKGPLNLMRSPQGQPVLVQAGSSADGQRFAARFAEVMFTVQHEKEASKEFCRGMRQQMATFGRGPDRCKILPGFMPIVGRTDEEARAKLGQLMQYVDSKSALKTMTERYGHDMSQFPLDGPIPDLPLSEKVQSYVKAAFAKARRENQTLRDLYNNIALARGYVVSCGSVKTVADTMEEWFSEEACDGFILMPAHFPEAFDDFIDMVIPELRRRGLFRTEYAGKTLRENLGLPVPPNRYTLAKEAGAGRKSGAM